ncbi:hypothetical protein [Candidatus Poriferisodalis sp.]|uniref:hypothetical protein n=1 Tax=Candidatus Poriferisodalis sp. TaxID=3101277 RepID=UPI003B020113
MTKKFTAALCALLVAASTLAVVAQPAAAHSQTVKRCAYDPFAGNQCWNEAVRHYHTPVQRNIPRPQTCSAGTTGTYPNCYPIPSDNSNHDKDNGGTDNGGQDGTGCHPAKGDTCGGDSDDGGGTDTGTKGTRSNRPKQPSTPIGCPYIDIVAFGGIPHEHDGLGCHHSVPGHQHGGGVARDPGTPPGDTTDRQELEFTEEMRQEMLDKFYEETERAGFPISKGTLAGLAVTGVGRALVCAPAALAAGAGAVVCGILLFGGSITVSEIVSHANRQPTQSGDDKDDESSDDSGEQDPSDQKNLNNAKDQNGGDQGKFTDAAYDEAVEEFTKTGDVDALTDFLNEWVCHHGTGTPTTGTCE